MRHITTQHLVGILNNLPSVVDAHVAEKKALGLIAHFVGLELAEYQNTPSMSALQKFSMNFAKTLDQTFASPPNPQIQKTNKGLAGDGKVKSENLAGNESENQECKKLSNNITIPEFSNAE